MVNQNSSKSTLLSGSFRVRNLVWNKHFTNVLTLEEPKKYITLAEDLLKKLRQDRRIQYCIFSVERGKRQNIASFHFQGYLEFNKVVDGMAFNKKHEFTDIQARMGTQQQAVEYVKKSESKIYDKFFEFGIPKKQLHLFNRKDADIPSDKSKQEVLIDLRLQQNYYESFEQIKNDFHHIFIKQKKGLKNLWDEYHPVKVLDVKPARTIWIYGHSGVGKTCGTNNYLKEEGYQDKNITKLKASNENRPKLGFSLEDEGREVLGIEEIRDNYPDFNDIIQMIDKGTRLEVKGSQIDNHYQLIIFNSLFPPEYIYRKLKLAHQVEVLRRLYKGDNKVYQLISDPTNYNLLVDKTNTLPLLLEEHLSS